MSTEKIMILKMLEEGRISTEEAARLMEAAHIEPSKPQEKKTEYKSNQNNHNITGDFRRRFDSLRCAMEPKIKEFADTFEPKLKSFTETVMEKTVDAADKISKSFVSHETSERKPAAPPVKGAGIEKNFEYTVSKSDYNELKLSSLNGNISLKGYNGDKIVLKVNYMAKAVGAEIKFVNLGNSYFLDYDENAFRFVSIEGYAPSALFSKLLLESTSGKLFLEGVAATDIKAYADAGDVYMKDIVCSSLKAECTKSNVSIENLTGQTVAIENIRGPVSVFNMDAANITIESSDAEINFMLKDLIKYKKYDISLLTSNARLKVNVPALSDTGYYVKGYTSLNSISMDIPSMNYLSREESFVEGKTMNFESASKKVSLILDTSNAPLTINA